MSIDSDVLYPRAEQEELAAAIPNATLRSVHAPQGHDAFLIEGAAVNELVREFRVEALAKSA